MSLTPYFDWCSNISLQFSALSNSGFLAISLLRSLKLSKKSTTKINHNFIELYYQNLQIYLLLSYSSCWLGWIAADARRFADDNALSLLGNGPWADLLTN